MLLRRRLLLDRDTEDVGFYKVDGLFQVRKSGGAGTVVSRGDEGLNVGFVVGEEGVDVLLVDGARALGLRKDEVGEGEEAEVGVEGEPGGVSLVRSDCRWHGRA